MSLKLNGTVIVPTIFSDHTSQVWKLDQKLFNAVYWSEIEWDFEEEAEFLHLAQLIDLIRVQNPKTSISLDISYLPYARQDKEISNNSTFALRTFAKLLNTLNIDDIRILDAHSNIVYSLIDEARELRPYTFIDNTLNEIKPDVICFPDGGAIERYQYVNYGRIVFAQKTRNQLTGELTQCIIHGEVKDNNVLMLDDLCDGGGTFTMLAKKLYEAGAKEVNLYVTHGIFSKGLQVLKDAGIKRIFDKNGEVFEFKGILTYRGCEK